MKQKVLWLSEPTLSVSLLLIKGGSLKKANDVLLANGVKNVDRDREDGTAKGFFLPVRPDNHKKHYAFNVIYFDGKNVADLAHEVVHLVMSIFQDRNIPVYRDNDEIFAYHVGYWMHCILNEVKVTELDHD